jgi:hypothetical protein
MRAPTLLLAAASLAAAPTFAQVSAPRNERLVDLSGIVSDTTGAPVPEVVVALDALAGEAPQRTRTSGDGRFALRGVLPGTRSVQLRRLGFRPYTVSVIVAAAGPPLPLEIMLTAIPLTLEEVRVEGVGADWHDAPIRLRDFEQLKQRSRFGYFIDRAEIGRRGATDVSDLLRRVPGANVRPSGRIGNTVQLRGCRPMVWLDNVSLPGAEVDEVARQEDIAGMAVYASFGALHARYMDRRAGNCGAILIWTR